jgi:hypothetical protein
MLHHFKKYRRRKGTTTNRNRTLGQYGTINKKGKRWKRHGFGVGDIHGTADGNLFFLIYGTGGFSSFIICSLFKSLALFQWRMNQSL